jgi:MraZ protein
MSIPADFRRVLEAGDPKCPENPHPRLVLLYGPHLKSCLHVYTVEAMAEIEADIQKLPRGSADRRRASQFILSKSWETEIDRDGRIVLPKDRRAQIGLGEGGGELKLVAMGDYFELWNLETYAREVEAEMEAFLEDQDTDFDPLTLLGGD